MVHLGLSGVEHAGATPEFLFLGPIIGKGDCIVVSKTEIVEDPEHPLIPPKYRLALANVNGSPVMRTLHQFVCGLLAPAEHPDDVQTILLTCMKTIRDDSVRSLRVLTLGIEWQQEMSVKVMLKAPKKPKMETIVLPFGFSLDPDLMKVNFKKSFDPGPSSDESSDAGRRRRVDRDREPAYSSSEEDRSGDVSFVI